MGAARNPQRLLTHHGYPLSELPTPALTGPKCSGRVASTRQLDLRGPLLVALFLLNPSITIAGIDWDPELTSVAEALPTPGHAEQVNQPFQVHVSPGGTTFFLWRDFNNVLSDSTLDEAQFKFCDGRLAFASNSSCPSYLNEYIFCELGTCDTLGLPISCRYYYLPKNLTSIYLKARYPNGTFGPVEEVTPIDPDSITGGKAGYDAVVGPDGAVHVVWAEVVPNVPLDPAPYSNARGFASVLPLAGQDSMYNKCGVDANLNAIPDSITYGGERLPCWRQLGSLSVICYRRRGPTGNWGPIHRNIANWTDLNAPDTLRAALFPRITVDDEGWVYVIWAQKGAQYPSCAWRLNSRNAFGPGGDQSRGEFNKGQFDCFFRKWSSFEQPNGPIVTDEVVNIAPDLTLPITMPEHHSRFEQFQDDDPVDIMVTGAGESAQVHVILCRCPTIGYPCPSSVDFFQDQDLYVHSSDGGETWSDRMPLTRAFGQIFACGDSCAQYSGTGAVPLVVEMGMARFLKNSPGPVHVVYNHEYADPTAGCDTCPGTPGCFSTNAYNHEVFHREIDPGEPDNWSPPYNDLGYRASIYDAADAPSSQPDVSAVGVIASDGSRHAFWYGAASECGTGPCTKVFHRRLDSEAFPDTVMSFTGSDRFIGCLDVAERGGIFHLLVSKGPEFLGYTPEDDDELPFEEQDHELFYKRGVFAPDSVDASPCDTTNLTRSFGKIIWEEHIVLCSDFTVDTCETLVILPGTTVILRPDYDGGGVDDDRVELTVKGKLVAEGTVDSAITFRAFQAPERATIGHWYGIRLLGGCARATLRHVSVSGAAYGIRDSPGNTDDKRVQACAYNDPLPGPGNLRIDQCRFAYNEICGVWAKGDKPDSTHDLLQVTSSDFLASPKGLIIENMASPDTGGFVIRGNTFRFNDEVGIEIRGQFGRTVVVDSNLVQGLGDDELIVALPDANSVDTGLLYDAMWAGDNSDAIRISRNTFFRVEGAGVDLQFDSEKVIGVKASVQVGYHVPDGGGDAKHGNLFSRVGVGLVSRYSEKVEALGNDFRFCGIGVLTTDGKLNLGGDGSSGKRNCFYNRAGENLLEDWTVFSNHVVLEPDEMADTLWAINNYWNPLVGIGDECATSSYFSKESEDLIRIASCADSTATPRHDTWGTQSMPLKRSAGEPRGGSQPESSRFNWALIAGRPNPFRGVLTIWFDVAKPDQDIDLTVYDVQGRVVRELAEGRFPVGRNSLIWDGKDGTGKRVSSGVYFYRMRASEYDSTRRIVFLR